MFDSKDSMWRTVNNSIILSKTPFKMSAVQVSLCGISKLYGPLVGVSSEYLNVLVGLLVKCTFGVVFKWFNYFSVVGYNYNIRGGRGRLSLSFYVGLVYRVFIRVPAGVSIFMGKRRMFLVSEDLVLLKLMGEFIRNLRNLLPYGDRGIVYKNERAKFKAVKKK